MNLNKNIDQLKSGRVELQVLSLVEVREDVVRFIDHALQALSNSDNPVLLAEKIFDFGTIALPSIEAAFSAERTASTREVLAALLVQLGSNKGGDLLLDIASRRGPNQILAVTSLAKANISGSADAIVQGLRNCNPDCYMKRENAPFILAFLVALRRLKYTIPHDLTTRFTGPGVPSEIAKFFV